MTSWVLTLFVSLNLAMLLTAAGTYLCRSAKEKAGQAE